MSRLKHLTILGGGPAGLTLGYYAKKNRLDFTIYEASEKIGGNSVTIRHGDSRFDAGAHLLQTTELELLEEIRDLLGEELKKVLLPLQTYVCRRLIDFPFTPLNLLRNLGLWPFVKIVFENICGKFADGLDGSFESFAVRGYGKTLANDLLLNYSRKLWGRPCDLLSSDIAGKQLRGLDLRDFLVEAFKGRTGKVQRLLGVMYYPTNGFGTIVERLGEYCGRNNVHTDSEVTKVFHDYRRIEKVEINHRLLVDTDEVASTLPLPLFLQIMHPKPPDEILDAACSLRFRDLIIVALFLDKKSVTRSASVHFPNPDFVLTRVHEPKNRSDYMSPAEATSIVAEIPCHKNDDLWNLEDRRLIQIVSSEMSSIGWIKKEHVTDGLVRRLKYAYPILDIDYKQKVQRVFDFISKYSNLKMAGRNGTFAYLSFHHIMQMSKRLIEEYLD